MNLGLVMRSPKFRILLYIIIFGGACLTVMLLHNTHTHLKEAESSFAMCRQEKEKCEQGKDSVSAQLQVLYEQKKRLEMTLQQERLDHQKAKEGIEKKSLETEAVHAQLQKEMSELQSKYTQLSTDYKSLKEANDQGQSELADMKESYASLEKEKQNLNIELSTQLQTLHQQEAEVNQLNDQLKMISIEKQQMDHENAQRIKKYDSNLLSCQKQHQQLMLQFDEISLNLNNCITGRNNSRQEILHISPKQMAQYTKNNIPHDTGEKIEQEVEQKDKSVHNQVGKKAKQYSEAVEGERTAERLATADDIIGSEFNDTLLSNSSSVLFVGNINVDNKQLDIPLTETTVKTSITGTAKSNLQEGNVHGNIIITKQESTIKKGDLTTKKLDTDNPLHNPPLVEPHITNSTRLKIKTINEQLVLTKPINNSAIHSEQDSIEMAKPLKNKALQLEHTAPSQDHNSSRKLFPPLSDQNQEKREAVQSQSHLENLMKKIQSGGVLQNTFHNSNLPSYEVERQQDYIDPVKEEPNAKMSFRKYVPFGNDLYAKRYDGSWVQNYNREDNPSDNGRDDEYGDDQGMGNIPE